MEKLFFNKPRPATKAACVNLGNIYYFWILFLNSGWLKKEKFFSTSGSHFVVADDNDDFVGTSTLLSAKGHSERFQVKVNIILTCFSGPIKAENQYIFPCSHVQKLRQEGASMHGMHSKIEHCGWAGGPLEIIYHLLGSLRDRNI